MLELDILLNRYIDHIYFQSSDEMQDLFMRLLSQEDQTLFDWLCKREKADSEFQDMVNRILNIPFSF